MTRALTISNDTWRRRIVAAIERAPFGSRVEIRDPKRSIDQNAMMWALLEEIARQKTHAGRYYTPDQWKILFMHALGEEVQFIPSLEGNTFVPYGFQSSKLSKDQMSELIEFIISWGSTHGVVFNNELIGGRHVEDPSEYGMQHNTKETA